MISFGTSMNSNGNGNSEQLCCAVCGVHSTLACVLCKSVYYCGKEHQKKHWKSHKSQCVTYQVSHSYKYGRHLTTIRPLKAGELIIEEKPLIVAPKSHGLPVCLGCHATITKTEEDVLFRCVKCKWPLCSSECENHINHVEECKALKTVRDAAAPVTIDSVRGHPSYSIIGPLRCLNLKKKSPADWQRLLDMQSHLNEWINTEMYKQYYSVHTAPLLAKVYGDVTEKEVLELCGIFDTNCHEVRINGSKMRALFPIAALVTHDCIPNTRRILITEPELTMQIFSSTTIGKDTMLRACYTKAMWPTTQRRLHLIQTKHFVCSCKRCKDPKECMAMLGALKCSKCKGACFCEDPLNLKSPWKCEKCNHTLPSNSVNSANESLRTELIHTGSQASIQNNPQLLEEFILKYQDALMPTHSHCAEAKYALVQLYGLQKTTDMSDEILNRQEVLCRDLLTLADILEPGFSRLRGELLFCLESVTLEKSKRMVSSGHLTAGQELEKEAKKYLNEAVELLKVEPSMKEIVQKRIKELES